MKICHNCDKLHDSDVVWQGWPVCTQACRDALQARVDAWLA